jgi:SprT protein
VKSVDPAKVAELLGIATKSQKHDIEEKITECLGIANKLFPLDMDGDKWYTRPTVRFDLRGRTAGEAWATDIRLNVHLLNEFYDEMLSVTLPHEIAHCVVIQNCGYAEAPHGWRWREVMRAFGLPPNRAHSMPTKAARVHKRPHKYVCGPCGKEWYLTDRMHRSIESGRYRICSSCRTRLIHMDSEMP